MFNIDKIVGTVTGNSGGASASSVFHLDAINYSWVKDYARDQEIRSEIEDLRQKIADTGKLPIHRDELKERFKGSIKQSNEFRMKQIGAQLSSVQNREEHIFSENSIGVRKVLGAPYLPYLIDLSPSDLDIIFSELPEGVKQKEIEHTIESCQKRIKELEAIIDKELSPQGRWVHRDDGKPTPYPTGCRWKAFVDTWKKVQSRFDGPVTINGNALKTDAEYKAHAVLMLAKVNKLPPLRKPL